MDAGLTSYGENAQATDTRTRFSGLSPVEQRELLDRTLTGLDRATTLARQLRAPLQTDPAGGGELR